MSQLRQLQSAFHGYVLHGRDDLIDQVVSTPGADARLRLDVYANAYRLRLMEALQTDYPGVHGLLGDAQFARLCLEYIAAHPSRHPSLRRFGAGLAGFLGDCDSYRKQAVLAELAAFEWAQGEVFDAADAAVATLDQLAGVAPAHWPQMQLELHPSRRLLQLRWNVPLIWQALDAQQAPPAPRAAAEPFAWVLWRQELSPHWRSLEVDEAWALRQAGAGHGFGEICEGLAQWLDPEHIPLRAAGFIKQWVSDGLVSALR